MSCLNFYIVTIVTGIMVTLLLYVKNPNEKNYFQLRSETMLDEIIGAGEGNWTLGLNVGNVSLYHWATPAN